LLASLLASRPNSRPLASLLVSKLNNKPLASLLANRLNSRPLASLLASGLNSRPINKIVNKIENKVEVLFCCYYQISKVVKLIRKAYRSKALVLPDSMVLFLFKYLNSLLRCK